MSRETEKILKGFQQFMDAHSDKNLTEDDVNRLMKEYMSEYNNHLPKPVTVETAKTSDDYMELAYDADTIKDALKYAKEALKLNPNNFDAELMIIDLKNTDDTKCVRDLKKAVEKATHNMKQDGYFDEDNIGHFWGIIETRPYMRLRHRYVQLLIDCAMIQQARLECEELIHLCENDNLGIRYQLMHIYAYFEDEQAALRLHERFDNHNETEMLLPLSVLYYKKGNYVKAADYLRRLNSINKDAVQFIKCLAGLDSDKIFDKQQELSFGYRPNTIEELMIELENNFYLFHNLDAYFDWAYRKSKSK